MNLNYIHFRSDVKMGNSILCSFFNAGRCFAQAAKECKRTDGIRKHLCSQIKTSTGKPCGGGHGRGDHDNVKHGN